MAETEVRLVLEMDLLDVVDENDQPAGKTTTKEAAHSQGILHRCAAVFVFDQRGRLYVQRHKELGLLDHSVGGHVDAGEDYETAAYREAQEELGIRNTKLSKIATSYRSSEFMPFGNIQHMFGIYECRPKHWTFKPNEEVEEIFPKEIKDIIEDMHNQPGKFTVGFMNTMAKFIEVKKLPVKFDLETARKNWSKP